MKYFLQILIAAIIIAITTGFYLKNSGNNNGEIVIGISVLTMAFVFMPTFIYYRYKDKKLNNFKLNSKENNKKKDI